MNPLPPDEFLRQLAQLVYRQYGLVPRSVAVRFAAGEFRLRLPEPWPAPGGPDAPAADIASQILDVLGRADRPLKGRAIAARAGRPYSGQFRQKLSELKEAGDIRLTPEGYALADDDA